MGDLKLNKENLESIETEFQSTIDGAHYPTKKFWQGI